MTTAPHIAHRGLLVDPGGTDRLVSTSWGERCRLRLSASVTGGALAVMDYYAPAGFGPPRHVHRNDDEIFFVRSGHLVLWTPHECRMVGPDDLVLLPKRAAHTWRAYGDAEVHLQVTTAPGEFESFFERIVQRGLTIDQVDQLVEVASQAGMDIVGPPLSDDEVAAILRGEAV
jgi:mannose-6-phosphate isomerase-like protein (cupin superfamily)